METTAMRCSKAHLLAIVVVAVLASNATGFATEPVRFAPPIHYAIGNGPDCISAADLNGDGKTDLIVTTQSDSNVNVLIGRGDGSFAAPIARSAGADRIIASVVGDFNRDAKVDVAVITAARQVSVLLGNGDGTFANAPTISTVPGTVGSVKTADINNDGTPDLLIGSLSEQPAILISNGDGSFAPPILLPLPTSAEQTVTLSCLAAGDLNGDGRLDIVGASWDPYITKTFIYLQNPDNTFQSPTGVASSFEIHDLAIIDINRDGFADVVGIYNVALFLYLGAGDGTIATPAFGLEIGTTPTRVAFADFNGDGTIDVASSGKNVALTIRTIEVDGTVTTVGPNYRGYGVQDLPQFGFNSDATSITAADLNGDGWPDVVTADPTTNLISVFLNGAKTVVTLKALPEASTPGSAVALMATVASASGDAPTATGSVTFYDGTTALGTATLDATATASVTFTPVAVNNPYHGIRALYSGDAQHIGSSAPALLYTVGFPSRTSLSISPGDPKLKDAVTLTATISSPYADVNPGLVNFYDGSTFLQGITLTDNVATFSISTLAMGSHELSAHYLSIQPFSYLLDSSDSTIVNIGFNPKTAIAAAATAARVATPVTLSATVSTVSGIPTGVVGFSDGVTLLGNAPLSDGVATLATLFEAAGPRTIHVTYAGDGTYAAASTDLVVQVAASDSALGPTWPFDYLLLGKPQQIVFDPVLNRVYVLNATYSRVDAVNVASRTLVGTIPAGYIDGASLDVSPDGKFLFFLGGNGVWSKIDTSSLQIVGTYDGSSHGTKILSDGTIIFCTAISSDHKKALRVSSSVTQVGKDTVPSTYIGIFDVNTKSWTSKYINKGAYPRGAINKDGSRVAVTFGLFVAVYDDSLNELFQIQNADAVGFSVDGRALYAVQGVTDGNTYYGIKGPTIVVYDAGTGELLARYPNVVINGNWLTYDAVAWDGTLVGSWTGLAFYDLSRVPTVPAPSTTPSTVFSINPNVGPPSLSTVVSLQLDHPGPIYFGSGATRASAALYGAAYAIAPPSPVPGPVDVVAWHSTNFPLLLPLGFSYGPSIDHVDTLMGDPGGGATLKVYGYGFDDIAGVTVGGKSASSPGLAAPVLSNRLPTLQMITATTPAGTPGSVADIGVTTSNGSTTLRRSYTYARSIRTYVKDGPKTALLLDPVRKYVYAANGATIEVFDLANRAFKAPLSPSTVTPNSNLGPMTLNRDGTRLVVADLGEKLLHIVDPETSSSTGVDLSSLKASDSDSPTAVALELLSDGTIFVAAKATNGYSCACTGILDLGTLTITRIPYFRFNPKLSVISVLGGTRIIVGTDVYDAESMQWKSTFAYYDVNSGQYLSPTASDLLSPSAFSADGLHGITTNGELLDSRSRAVGKLNYQGLSESGTDGPLLFAPGGGLIFKSKGGSSTTPVLDVFDTNTGWLRTRITLTDQPTAYLSAVAPYSRPLAIAENGTTIVLVTSTGLTVVDMPNPLLAIGSLYPEQGTPAGGNEVLVTGSGFGEGMAMNVAGQSSVATLTDSNHLTFTAPSLPEGCYPISLQNVDGELYTLDCGYKVRSASVPSLASISPPTAFFYQAPTSLTVAGSNFTPASTLIFDSVSLITEYLGPTSLRARTPLDVKVGTFSIAVHNPDPGGGRSEAVSFSIVGNPPPVIESISPSVLYNDAGARVVQLRGQHFYAGSTLTWDGAAVAPTSANESTLEFLIIVDDESTRYGIGTHSITVSNPPPGGGTSNTITLNIVERPDTTPPSVSLTSPHYGETVAGTGVMLIAAASDDKGVCHVQFKIDGNVIGTEQVAPPYSFDWDATKMSNGPHTISASAHDPAGNSVESAAVAVTVNNDTDFTFNMSSGSANLATTVAGVPVTFDITVMPTSGFTGSISLVCSGAPTASTCNVSPNPAMISGTAASPIKITVSTTARSGATPATTARNTGAQTLQKNRWSLWMGLVVLAFVCSLRNRRCRIHVVGLVGSCVLLVLSFACGGGNPTTERQTGTPAGTYTITVSATSGNVTHNLALTLIVN